MISKLPNTGTTIFTVMSALANEHNAVNLSQGFPDFPVDKNLIDLCYNASLNGYNQYAPMPGLPTLRNGISDCINSIYGKNIDPDKEITVTSGATEALFAAISVIVNKNDEVIIFDPSYDSYEPAVILAGGVPVRIPLTFPEYKIDWEKVFERVNKKTKLIILNSPNNPAGSVIDENDIFNLTKLISGNDMYILSDEVYEHIVFDGVKHYSMLIDDELYKKSFIVSSFGKTFHITGWKVGYCTAPENLTSELRKIHQYLTFSTSTPFQWALSEYIKDIDKIKNLKHFYESKRDFFLSLIKNTKFKPLKCSGTYFQLLDYSDITDENDFEFAKRLTIEYKVASIPVSVFYENKTDNKVLRFCFAKQKETIEKAVEMLSKLR
ncbi:MAG TPA: methionine aminotransferase [Ignavibacteria bacterium]|nr:methionine aminotransferase [Ignavibacteria bacterium]